MVVVVINHYSEKTIDYRKIFEGIDKEILFITRTKHKDDFKDIFPNRMVFDSLDNGDEVEKALEEIHAQEEIESIVVSYEFDIERFAKLREKLHIKGQSFLSAIQFRDKSKMIEQVKDAVKVPNYAVVNSKSDIIDFAEKQFYPIIIKPIDGAGSVGFQKFNSLDEIVNYIDNNTAYPLLAETFISGSMYHTDGIFENSEIKLFSCSLYYNDCHVNDNAIGSALVDEDTELFVRMRNETYNVLKSLKTPEHAIAFHSEFFLTPSNDIVFCEIGSRVGGGRINDVIYHKQGVDILSESIRAQCDKLYSFDVEKIKKSNKSYGFMLFPPRKGTLISINKDVPFDWVVSFDIRENKIGQTLKSSETSVSEIASAIVEGECMNDVFNKLQLLSDWLEKNIVWDFLV